MEKLVLKYTAEKIDEIEKNKGNIPIENCVFDTTINNFVLFLMKGMDISKNVAMSKLNEYLLEKDKEDLTLEIMEALVDTGFLSRGLEIDKMRELLANRKKEIANEIEQQLLQQE